MNQFNSREEYAEALKRGLDALPPFYVASVCIWCDGKGERRQPLSDGFQRGYHWGNGPCKCCDGTGLLQGKAPAPRSVVEQVLNAGTRHV